MKKYRIIIILYIIILCPLKVCAVSYKDEIDNIAEQYDINRNKIYDITLDDMLNFITETTLGQLKEPIKIFTKVLIIIILCSATKAVTVGDNITQTTNILCVLLIFTVCFAPLKNILDMVSSNLIDIKNFMISFLPVFSAINLASGDVVTASVTGSFFLAGIVTICNLCIDVIIPSVQIFLVLIITQTTQNILDLKSISEFYLKSVKWILKSIVSVISVVLTMQTTLTRPSDSLKIKAGKLLAGSAVPVIGSVLQDAVGGVYAGMEVIKGFAGVVGIIGIINIFLPSIIMLIIYSVCFSLLYISSDIFSIKPVSQCIKCFENIIELMISVIVIFIILFVFFMVIVIMFTKGL